MDHLARNTDGDELMFIHRGSASLLCDFGSSVIATMIPLTFIANRFVVCTFFVPRPFETDPGALKIPFFHTRTTMKFSSITPATFSPATTSTLE